MFLTYLRRELRRRLRQAIFISLGLALGVGLVITVTAASGGVQNAQATVLHSLYGVGTDVTVTKAAAQGSGEPAGFQVRQELKRSIEFGGQDFAVMTEAQLTRVRARAIGFVFQTFNLIPTLSAAENVETALVPLGVPTT
jgi:predicted ABC-type transport system involved in lysophospholipase L1 biosynthesis ATPase subunit